MTLFNYNSVVHDNNPIELVNIFQSVGDNDESLFFGELEKLFMQDSIRLGIHIGSGLINTYNISFSQNDSQEIDYLFFTIGEIFTGILDNHI